MMLPGTPREDLRGDVFSRFGRLHRERFHLGSNHCKDVVKLIRDIRRLHHIVGELQLTPDLGN
jgi:hypothetical protein